MNFRQLGKVAIALSALFIARPLIAAEPEVVPGEFLIKFKTPIQQKNFKQLSTVLGGTILRQVPNTNILVLKRSVVESAIKTAKALSKIEGVEVAEPNFIYRVSKTPNDPNLGKLWGMSNEGQDDSSKAPGVAGVDINALKAWDIQTGSKDVVVAVIDTGIDYTHPELKDNVWTNEAEANGKPGVDDDKNGFVDDIHGYDFVNKDGDPMDDHGHGSHCSGTIGAKGDNGAGIVGVNWDVRIMGVKFLSESGSGTSEDAISAIRYANQMGARVLSNSWGGGGFSDLLKQAIEETNASGASFIAAAGNNSTNNDTEPSYPANYDVPNVVSVAAISNKGSLASFSCYGRKTVHLGAPGVNIYSSIPGGYDSWSGTSMATPHVSGVAALLLANEPNMTGAEIKERLMSTARPLASLRGKTVTGGTLDAYLALTNQKAPPDLNDPSNWPNQAAVSISSEHPYKDKTNQTWEFRQAGATKISLYFETFDTEANYDKLTFYDKNGKKLGEMHGGQSGSWSDVFNTDYVKMVFTSDDSVSKTGFDITKAAWK